MKTYSFLDIVLRVNGVRITDFAEGDSVITAAPRVDAATDKIGADGNMAVSISADRSGEIVFKLQQTSPSNAFLQQLYNQQRDRTIKGISVFVADVARGDVGATKKGYIRTSPGVDYGAEVADKEWSLVVEDLTLTLGL